MPKISDCDHCLFSSHNYHLVCAVHPAGPIGDRCPGFRPDPIWKLRSIRTVLYYLVCQLATITGRWLCSLDSAGRRKSSYNCWKLIPYLLADALNAGQGLKGTVQP